MNARTKPQARYFAALVAALLFAVTASFRIPTSVAHAGELAGATPHAPAAAPVLAKRGPHDVLLPQITVRPTAAELAQALSQPLVADNSPFVRLGDTKSGGAYTTSPRMNFDMPYYSFGKTLPRAASRE